jgi:hypothetical protein
MNIFTIKLDLEPDPIQCSDPALPFGWIRIWFQKNDFKPPTGQAEDHQLVRIGNSNWTVNMGRAIIQSGWGVATSQDGKRQPVRTERGNQSGWQPVRAGAATGLLG